MIQLLGRICVWAIAFLSPWATFTQLGFFLTPITIAGVALLLLCVMDRVIAADLHIRVSSLILFFYSVVLFLSVTWSIDTTSFSNFSLWWIICVASYIGTRQFIDTRKHLNTTLIFVCLSLLPTYFLLQPVEFTYTTSGRLAVPGHNSNFTAYAVAGAFMVVAMFIYTFRASMFRFILLIPFVIFTPFILFPLGTRGAIISIGTVTVGFLIGRYLPRWSAMSALFLVCLIAIGITFGIFDAILSSADSLSDRSTGDLSGRTDLWKMAAERFYSSPLIGNGFGSSSKLGEAGVGAHNFFLIVLSDTGLVGMALVSAFIVSWAKEILKNIDKGATILLIFAAYWFPIATSGHWELAPYSWFVVGLTSQFSKIDNRFMAAFDETQNRPVTNLVTPKESGRRNSFA